MIRNYVMWRYCVRATLAAAWLCAAAPTSFAAPSPRSLVEVADLEDLAISPDGQSIAFRLDQASVESNRYRTTWFVQPLKGEGPPVRVAGGGEPLFTDAGTVIDETPVWAPDSRFLYFRALLAGEVQVWRAARDGSHAEAVTHDAADVQSFALSPDGERLLYEVGADRETIGRAEQAEYDQGVRIDGSVPIGQGLVRSGLVTGRLSTQRFTGDWMQRSGLLTDAPKRSLVVDLKTLTSYPASEVDLASFAAIRSPNAVLSSLGTSFSVRSSETGWVAIVGGDANGPVLRVKAPEVGADIAVCAAEACQGASIVALAWRPGRRELVFTTLARDQGRAETLHLWDLANGRVRRLVRADGLMGGGRGINPGEGCAVGEVFAACVTAMADTPPRLERVDLETGERKVLFDPNQALAADRGPRAELIRWSDAEGRRFSGWLFPPVTSARRPAPLFITYYACPGYLRGGLGDEWPLASLAGAGIAALCIDGLPPDPAHPDALAQYQAAASAVRSVVAMLRAKGLVDPARVGMGGLSFGSEAVLWTAMTSLVLAAASVSSPALTPTYFQFHALQGGNFRTMLREEWGLGSPAETPDRWRLISPAFNVDEIRAPLLMQMPEQEYLEALDYFTPLAEAGKPVELYAFPNEPHIKIQPRHKLAVCERNLDWFRFWLQGYEDPDPLKADQYRRWRQLRAQVDSQEGRHR